MPDTGRPPYEPSRQESHISTQEWQSFESRMRRRRAQRCVLRAETALAAGLNEDARAAIDEARLLDASTPGLELLRARTAVEAVPAVRDRRAPRMLTVAAASLLMGFAAFGGWRLVRSDHAPAAQDVERTAASPQRDVILPSMSESLADRSVVVKTDVAHAQPVASDKVTPLQPRIEPTPAAPLPSAPRVAKASENPSTPVIEGVNALAPAPVPVSPAPSLPAAPPPVVTAANAAPSSPAAPRPADRAPDESARVRSVLTQYERAYSSLDASAATAVWPSVDERALSRAFSALQAQQLSLGRCDVMLSGATARANCSGSASWTPKVGSGRTQARRFDFTLQNNDGTWRIVTAQTR